MKLTQRPTTITILAIFLIGLTVFTVSKLQESKNALIMKQNEMARKDSLMADILRVQLAKLDSIENRFRTNFEYAYPRFKTFNENIDSSTVWKFSKVLVYYRLDSTDHYRDMYTGQLLLESGARQYKSDGDLLVGLAGEIGFCQIKPSTCLSYLERYTDSLMIKDDYLGSTDDFTFVYDNTIPNDVKVNKCKNWLSKVRNNLIMWGFITRIDLDKKGDVNTQLVSYNMGTAGMYRYKRNGGSINGHTYIQKIKAKLLVSSH